MQNGEFTQYMLCVKCKMYVPHHIYFMSYGNHQVKFKAVCEDCLKQAEDNDEENITGWIITISLEDWIKMQPPCKN